jgi:aminoglycoside 2'-N-acetyltransferase I
VHVRIVEDGEVTPETLAGLRTLLNEAFGGNFSDEDWQHTFGGTRVIALLGDVPVGHAAVVPRTLWIGQRPFRSGYVEGVATAPACQRQGVGSLVMAHALEVVRAGLDMGALMTGVHAFYRRCGFESWQGPTFVKRGGQLERSADEDDALMVLRFGPSAELDLQAPIACEARPGDDW